MGWGNEVAVDVHGRCVFIKGGGGVKSAPIPSIGTLWDGIRLRKDRGFQL